MFGRLTPMVKNLLLINVGLFFIFYLTGLDMGEIMGLRYVGSSEFRPYQIFTHMFAHAGTWHLFGNMFALFIFGPMLESFWGSKKFLIFYLVCGFGASLLYSGVHFYEVKSLYSDMVTYTEQPNPESFNLFIQDHRPDLYGQLGSFIDEYSYAPNDASYIRQSETIVEQIYVMQANMPLVGASGAVFGILMAFGMLFPNLQLILLFPPIPIRAKYLVLFYGLFELYSVIIQRPGDNVAHFAHLGGMLFAYILIRYWRKSGRDYSNV